MQFHSHANQSHFHKNGFALRLALKLRHKGTRKWPIDLVYRAPAEIGLFETNWCCWLCQRRVNTPLFNM